MVEPCVLKKDGKSLRLGTPEGLAKHVHAAVNVREAGTPLIMASSFKDRNLLAVIGDEVLFFLTFLPLYTYKYQDSITGLLLAGVGHINEHQKKNFLVVDSSMVATSRPPSERY